MHSVGVVIVPGMKLMSIAALAVFQAVNTFKERKVYDIHILSEHGGHVPTAAGFGIDSERISDAIYDTVLVAAFDDTTLAPPEIIRFVRAAAKTSRRIGSFCTGAFLLAEAGLIAGRRATTHWHYARELQARFSDIRILTDRLFVNDGTIWTSAGMAAGIDLVLALVEEDLGSELARTIARRMLLERRRQGGQAQMSSLLDLEPRSDRIQRVLGYIKARLGEELTVAQLAEVARLSPRQFSRAFSSELGQSPAKVVERLRAEAARSLAVDRRRSLDEIAGEVGFDSRERMRRVFLRLYGQTPQTFRRQNRAMITQEINGSPA